MDEEGFFNQGSQVEEWRHISAFEHFDGLTDFSILLYRILLFRPFKTKEFAFL